MSNPNPVPRLSLPPERCLIMGVLNVTPDSFSDGGRFTALDQALRHAERLVSEGADIIDVGGESTRPGAPAVPVQLELDRVVPVIEALRRRTDRIISIDTSKPAVMRAAVSAGAGLVNDVFALRREGALDAARDLDVPVCLMHMQGEPANMQAAPHYTDLVAEVIDFLEQRVACCLNAGLRRNQLILDPGFGFGKRLAHNLALLRELPRLCALGYPVLAGLSRKAMIGELLDRPVNDRLHGGLALAVIAYLHGARIIRTHDVAPTVDAIRVAMAVTGT